MAKRSAKRAATKAAWEALAIELTGVFPQLDFQDIISAVLAGKGDRSVIMVTLADLADAQLGSSRRGDHSNANAPLQPLCELPCSTRASIRAQANPAAMTADHVLLPADQLDVHVRSVLDVVPDAPHALIVTLLEQCKGDTDDVALRLLTDQSWRCAASEASPDSVSAADVPASLPRSADDSALTSASSDDEDISALQDLLARTSIEGQPASLLNLALHAVLDVWVLVQPRARAVLSSAVLELVIARGRQRASLLSAHVGQDLHAGAEGSADNKDVSDNDDSDYQLLDLIRLDKNLADLVGKLAASEASSGGGCGSDGGSLSFSLIHSDEGFDSDEYSAIDADAGVAGSSTNDDADAFSLVDHTDFVSLQASSLSKGDDDGDEDGDGDGEDDDVVVVVGDGDGECDDANEQPAGQVASPQVFDEWAGERTAAAHTDVFSDAYASLQQYLSAHMDRVLAVDGAMAAAMQHCENEEASRALAIQLEMQEAERDRALAESLQVMDWQVHGAGGGGVSEDPSPLPCHVPLYDGPLPSPFRAATTPAATVTHHCPTPRTVSMQPRAEPAPAAAGLSAFSIDPRFVIPMFPPGYRIRRIDNILDPAAAAAFRQQLGEMHVNRQQIAFHSTHPGKASRILRRGPVQPGTAAGYYGDGIYLAPNPETVLPRCGRGVLLVCSVLPGRVFRCPGVMLGISCMPGFDSHCSPDGSEIVLFKAQRVLPCLLVSFDCVSSSRRRSRRRRRGHGRALPAG